MLIALALALPPRPYGDAAEYLLMGESWAAHGSPELRPGDVDALRRRAAEASVAVRPEDALGNYFQAGDGRSYSYHFWTYPLATLPARALLALVGGDALRAGPVTNAVLFGAAMAAVLLKAAAPANARRRAAALLVSSPALGFLLWPHPEVFSFALATLALVAGSRGSMPLAVLLAALASTQNPPLVLLGLVEAARPWLIGAPRKLSRRDGAVLFIAALVALASPAFNFVQFGTPNMAAAQTASAGAVSAGKALGLLFDLNVGLVRYAPLTVLLTVAVVPLVVRGRRAMDAALLATLVVMMLAASATGNWNHGTTGPSRYVVWMIPLLVSLLALGDTAQAAARRRGWPVALALAAAAQAGVALARGGVLAPLDYLDHSRLARAVMDRWPAAYTPVQEVFRERTAHTEMDLDAPFVYPQEGPCRKALVRWKHAETLRARCGDHPAAARRFFESRPPREEKPWWVYIDYP